MPHIPSHIVLKFVGGPMDGIYPGGTEYPENIGLLLYGYYVRSKEGEIGAIIQPMSPRGLPATFMPEHLRTEGIKGGKYLVVGNEEIDGRTIIKIKYEGIGGHPDAE